MSRGHAIDSHAILVSLTLTSRSEGFGDALETEERDWNHYAIQYGDHEQSFDVETFKVFLVPKQNGKSWSKQCPRMRNFTVSVCYVCMLFLFVLPSIAASSSQRSSV